MMLIYIWTLVWDVLIVISLLEIIKCYNQENRKGTIGWFVSLLLAIIIGFAGIIWL